jgi:hypothetical protein
MWKTKKVLENDVNSLHRSLLFSGLRQNFIIDYLPFASVFSLSILHFSLMLPILFSQETPIESRIFLYFTSYLFAWPCILLLKYRYAIRWGIVERWYDWPIFIFQLLVFCGLYGFFIASIWAQIWRYLKFL